MRKMRILPMIMAGVLAAASAGQVSAALIGQSAATGAAALKEWNVISFNNLNTVHHIEGRILAGSLTSGGNFEAQNKSGTSSYGTPTVTVVNDASFNGKVMNGGSVVVGKNASGQIEGSGGTATMKVGQTSSVNVINNTVTVSANQGTDFTNTVASQMTDIKASLTSLSANLKALATTSNVQLLQPAGSAQTNDNQNSPYWNTNQINVTGTGLAVLNLTEEQFENFGASQKEFKITLPTGATLVINVAGTNIDYSGKVNLFDNDQNVIWNFYQATSINLQNQFSGAVLGVFADITAGNSGNVDGTIVGNTVKQNGNGEIHTLPFQGDLSSVTGGVVSTAPEPSTWAMLILGFGLIGFVMRRREKAGLAVQVA